jgi:hypothetical protein
MQVRLLTNTVKLQLIELPAPSPVSQVTVVEPTGKLEPEGGLQAEIGAEQLSLSVGAGKLTAAKPSPGEGSLTMTLAGQVMVNGCES